MMDGVSKSFTFSISKSFSSEFTRKRAEGMKASLPNSVWTPGTQTVKNNSGDRGKQFPFFPLQNKIKQNDE